MIRMIISFLVLLFSLGHALGAAEEKHCPRHLGNKSPLPDSKEIREKISQLSDLYRLLEQRQMAEYPGPLDRRREQERLALLTWLSKVCDPKGGHWEELLCLALRLDPSDRLRWAAAEQLGALSDISPRALNLLQDTVLRPGGWLPLRSAAMLSLASHIRRSPHTRLDRFFPVFEELLWNPYLNFAEPVVQSLKQIGLEHPKVRLLMEKILEDSGKRLLEEGRLAALTALLEASRLEETTRLLIQGLSISEQRHQSIRNVALSWVNGNF